MLPGWPSYPESYPVNPWLQAHLSELKRTKKRPKSLIYLGLLYSSALMRTLRWWSRGELNPRPQAITGQIYMLSRLI